MYQKLNEVGSCRCNNVLIFPNDIRLKTTIACINNLVGYATRILRSVKLLDRLQKRILLSTLDLKPNATGKICHKPHSFKHSIKNDIWRRESLPNVCPAQSIVCFLVLYFSCLFLISVQWRLLTCPWILHKMWVELWGDYEIQRPTSRSRSHCDESEIT